MNYQLCCYKCNKHCGHPYKLICSNNGEWYLGPDACGEFSWVHVKEPAEFLKDIPKGWEENKCHEQEKKSFEFNGWDSDALVSSLWEIHLAPDCGCPFYAEHFMSEIRHENRLAKWSKWNKEMKKKYDKTDSEKLP